MAPNGRPPIEAEQRHPKELAFVGDGAAPNGRPPIEAEQRHPKELAFAGDGVVSYFAANYVWRRLPTQPVQNERSVCNKHHASLCTNKQMKLFLQSNFSSEIPSHLTADHTLGTKFEALLYLCYQNSPVDASNACFAFFEWSEAEWSKNRIEARDCVGLDDDRLNRDRNLQRDRDSGLNRSRDRCFITGRETRERSDERSCDHQVRGRDADRRRSYRFRSRDRNDRGDRRAPACDRDQERDRDHCDRHSHRSREHAGERSDRNDRRDRRVPRDRERDYDNSRRDGNRVHR